MSSSPFLLAKAEKLAYVLGGLGILAFAILGDHQKAWTPALFVLLGLILIISAAGGT